MISIGIDVGIRGAVVALDRHGKVIFYADCPVRPGAKGRKYFQPGEMRKILVQWIDLNAKVFIEYSQAMRKDGRAQGATSSHKTGEGYGLWVGIVVGLDMPYDVIPPKDWQRVMHSGEPGDPKKRSEAVCKKLFPDLPIYGPRGGYIDGRGDAALIAEFGRRMIK